MKVLVKEHPVHCLVFVFLWVLGIASGTVLIGQMSQLLHIDYASQVNAALASGPGFNAFGLITWLAAECLLFLLAAFAGVWLLGFPFPYVAMCLNGLLLGAGFWAILYLRGLPGFFAALLIAFLPYMPASACLLKTSVLSILAWRERFSAYCHKQRRVAVDPAYIALVRRQALCYLLLSGLGVALCTLLFGWVFPALA